MKFQLDLAAIDVNEMLCPEMPLTVLETCTRCLLRSINFNDTVYVEVVVYYHHF